MRLVALLFAVPALAVAQIQPGLWEVTGKIQGGNIPAAQIQMQNQKMTEEQRKAAGSALSAMSPEMARKTSGPDGRNAARAA
jgi:hypothetical protein